MGAIIGIANLNVSRSGLIGLACGGLLVMREMWIGERRYFFEGGYFDKQMFFSDIIHSMTLVLGLALVAVAAAALQSRVLGERKYVVFLTFAEPEPAETLAAKTRDRPWSEKEFENLSWMSPEYFFLCGLHSVASIRSNYRVRPFFSDAEVFDDTDYAYSPAGPCSHPATCPIRCRPVYSNDIT